MVNAYLPTLTEYQVQSKHATYSVVSLSEFLCAFSVFSVSLWLSFARTYQNHRDTEPAIAGESIKPGASAPGMIVRNFMEPANAGDSPNKTKTLRPILCRPLHGLASNREQPLGLTPQALCFRLLSQADHLVKNDRRKTKI